MSLAVPCALAAQPARGATWERDAIAFLETLRRADGGFAWPDEPDSALNPTFAAIACHRLLGLEPSRKEALINFVRSAPYPWPELRRRERPLRGFEYEQAQSLIWLGADASLLQGAAAGWKAPSEYTTRYEGGGNPVFSQEVAAMRTRALLGIETHEPEWRSYVLERCRADGAFNNTPASDGSGGHVMNTLWGLLALELLGVDPPFPAATVEWLRRCQRADGGFSYSPEAGAGAVSSAAWTWSAVQALGRLGSEPADRANCLAFLSSLGSEGGGYSDKPRIAADPVSTWRVVETLRLYDAAPTPPPQRRRATAVCPRAYKAFTIQFQAPGAGSPADAVDLARSLRIHLWGAKNAKPGWLERAQEIARERDVPVTFFPSNEEYGTYISVPGLGAYSHLSDVYAPAGSDFGASMANPRQPVPWARFRDERIGALKRAGGGNIWQFNENEELSRVLLDEAVETGTFDAVSSFHFGNENFLRSQPFLNIYRPQLPIVGLQDNHAGEPWWSSSVLAGFRTVFLAKEPDWKGWREALRRNLIVAIRRDSVTNHEERIAGGGNEVRREVLRRRRQWDWRGRLPAALVQVIRPGDSFEEGRPEDGVALRIRTRHDHTQHGIIREPIYEFVSLMADGKPASARLVERNNDRGALIDSYHVAHLSQAGAGAHSAEVTVRQAQSGESRKITVEWTG